MQLSLVIATMWSCVDDRPTGRYDITATATGPRVSIQPDGSAAPFLRDGTWDLFTPASRVFGQLEGNNVFLGPRNVFSGLVTMHHCHILSDPALKRNLTPLEGTAAEQLVRTLRPFSYTVDGRFGCGFLAGDVPDRFVSRDPVDERPVAIDYHSLMVELWAAVQHLQNRVDRLEEGQQRTSPVDG